MAKETPKIDRLNWIAENLKIINKGGELVNLQPNIGQLMLHNTIDLQRLHGFPVRICLLKPRKVGWSTWCVADSMCDVVNKPNLAALEVSADEEATDTIFRMAKLMHDELRPTYKRKTEYSNRKEIIYAPPHRSRIIAQTAGKLVLARGPTYRKVHCSEVAFWRNATQQLGGLYQSVYNDPNTSIILESTAFGIGGAFYDTFWQSVERLKANREDYNGFIPVFFGWHQFPEYSAKLTEGTVLTYTGLEEELIAKYKLTPEQVYWRRLKVAELNGDEGLFKQEYPLNAREAFQASGRSVIPQTWIDKWYARVKGGRTCLFDKDVTGEVEIRDINSQEECWRVWFKPQYAHQYSMGIDTMEGRTSDTDNPRSDIDWHGVVIFDRTNQVVVAQYHGRCTQQELGEQALLAAMYYNEAYVGIELPNGKTVLDVFRAKQYPNLYRRQVHDLQDVESDTDDYGWRTTTITRHWLVEGLIGIIRDNDLAIYSAEILNEMRTFIRDKTGTPIHQTGEHDDLLFGLMIALQVHIRCPLNAMSYPHDFTGQERKEHLQNLATPGAVDDESDMCLVGDFDSDGEYTR